MEVDAHHFLAVASVPVATSNLEALRLGPPAKLISF
jgi:hypothetical protein